MTLTKEQKKEYNRLYNIKNKEYYRNYNVLHRQSPEGKKSSRISCWKTQGVICFNFDLLYDIFLKTTHCEFCNRELTVDRYNSSTTKCLDHDHSINNRFNIRGVLCHKCNTNDVLE
tara:strand:+ start:175 stop:522 length:348 start_codon:yes stop_codon:yes gene_type:complete